MVEGHVTQRGTRVLREVLAMRPVGDALFRRKKERLVMKLLHEAGTPDGIPNYRIVDADGKERILDFALAGIHDFARIQELSMAHGSKAMGRRQQSVECRGRRWMAIRFGNRRRLRG